MGKEAVKKSRLSLTNLAVIECCRECTCGKSTFEERCRKFLELNNADALDYHELSELLKVYIPAP